MAGLGVLRRDTTHSIAGGVCSGLAAYFDLSKDRIRIAAILLFIFGGSGILLYAILWVAVPAATTQQEIEYMKRHNG